MCKIDLCQQTLKEQLLVIGPFCVKHLFSVHYKHFMKKKIYTRLSAVLQKTKRTNLRTHVLLPHMEKK